MDKNDSSKHLYGLHSKELVDFSSSESEQNDLDDDIKPPLYTYEELRKNLVVCDRRGTRNYESDVSEQNSDVEEARAESPLPDHIMNKTKNLTAEQIQKELKKRLTKTYCYICKRQNDSAQFYRHYNSGTHFTNVHKWLKEYTSNLKKPVDVKYLFCEACNLPLAGNDKAKSHYNSSGHLKNLKKFCTVCCRGIPPHNVSAHQSSKGHLKKLEIIAKTNEENNMPDTSYAGALKRQDSIDNRQPVIKETITTDGDNLSNYLQQLKLIDDKVATPESISTKLAKLMDNKYCQFCPDIKKVNKKHLKKGHFDNVVQWLENEIAKLENPVDWTLFFCDICNLPLSGNNNALEHYDTILHLDAVKTFCKVCWQSFSNTSLQQHNQTNKHLKNLNAAANISSDLNLTIEEEEMPAVDSPLATTTSKLITKTPSNCHYFIQDPKPMKIYNRVANYVLRFLSQTFCYVCNVPVATFHHYQSQQHMRTFRKWLENNCNLMELFGIRDIEELVCIGCRIVFHDSKVAEFHYLSEEHKGAMQTFCKLCLVYENNPIHKEHNKQLEEYNSKKNKDPFVIINNKNPSVLLATNLRIMLTPSMCDICDMQVTPINLFHYTDRNHIWMVRNWLSYGMQTLNTFVDPRLIFCEACPMVLSGTEAARAHYTDLEHLLNQPLYCPHCIFKGTTSESILHHAMSLEHMLRLDHSVKLQNQVSIGKQPSIRVPPYNPILGEKLICKSTNQTVPVTAVANFMELVSQRANNAEENQLRIQMDREVSRLLELLYCSGKVPLKEAVNYLNVVNQKLVNKMNK